MSSCPAPWPTRPRPAAETPTTAGCAGTSRLPGGRCARMPWAGAGRGPARRLVARHGLDPARVHSAAPGADPAPLAPGTDGATRLLCVAAVVPRKGHPRLLDALATVADLPWTCDCVGGVRADAAHVAQLKGHMAELDLAGRVRLTGPRAGAELAASYAAADLLVLASHAETYGMVLTEALAR